MAIKLSLEPKNNQLVPINALKEWSENLEKVQDENVWKKIFDKTSGKPENYRKRVSEINNIIKKLPAPTEEKGSRVWFQSVFLQPFGGKATKEAKEIFEALAKGVTNEASFKELEKATQEYNQALRDATTKLAKSAQELNKILMDGFAPATNAFAKEYKDKKSAAAGAAGAGGTAAGGAPAGGVAGTAPTTSESIDRELYQSKKLLELGFITQNEYLAKLVEIKNKLLEKTEYITLPATEGAANPFAPPTTPAPAAATPTQANPAAPAATPAAAPTAPAGVAPAASTAAQPRSSAKTAYAGGYGKRDIRKSVMDAQNVFDQVAQQTSNKVTKQAWKATFLDMLSKGIIREDAYDEQLTQYGYTPAVIDSLWDDYISKYQQNTSRIDPGEKVTQEIVKALETPAVTASLAAIKATEETNPPAAEAEKEKVTAALDAVATADPAAAPAVESAKAVVTAGEGAPKSTVDSLPAEVRGILTSPPAAETPKTIDPNIYQNAFNEVVEANRGRKITRLQWKQQIWTILKTPPTTVTESLKYDLAYSKKLLRFGFITESEYLASLVRTKSLLQELDAGTGTAPVAPPTDEETIDTELNTLGIKPEELKKAWTTISSNEANKQFIDPKDLETKDARPPAADPIDAAIKTLIGDETNPQGEIIKLATLASGMQDQMTRFAQGIVSEALSYKEKQLAKLYVKKQVLSEYTKTGNIPTKTQLNEFFIASILLAALAAALAWAASKLTAMFKDSYPSDRYGGSSGRSDTSDSKQTLTDMAAGLGGGLDVNGNFVDGSGNKVQPVAESITKITRDMQNIQTALNKAMEDIKAPANYKAGVTSEAMAATLTPATQQYAAVVTSQQKFYAALDEFSKEAARK